jgi:hypothetical protein
MQASRVMAESHMNNILDELWRIDTCEDVSEIMALFAEALQSKK